MIWGNAIWIWAPFGVVALAWALVIAFGLRAERIAREASLEEARIEALREEIRAKIESGKP